jgi:hypothetical protein
MLRKADKAWSLFDGIGVVARAVDLLAPCFCRSDAAEVPGENVFHGVIRGAHQNCKSGRLLQHSHALRAGNSLLQN